MSHAVRSASGGDWIAFALGEQVEIEGKVYHARHLIRTPPAGLVVAETIGVPPVPGLGEPPELSDLEAYPTWVWSPGGLANFKALRVAEIKAEAGRRILAAYPTWKQANMNMRATELADIRHDRSLTTEEEAEREALLAVAVWIKSVRDASDALEEALPDDADGLAEFDAATAEVWPA